MTKAPDIQQTKQGVEAVPGVRPEDLIASLPVALLNVCDVADRLSPDVSDLCASLQRIGQLEPIVVHPDAERPGYFVVSSGYRRAEACRQLGIPVRAEIRMHAPSAKQETAIILANSAHSFIERARLAVKLLSDGYAPQQLDEIFHCDKTARSRLLKVGRAVPTTSCIGWELLR